MKVNKRNVLPRMPDTDMQNTEGCNTKTLYKSKLINKIQIPQTPYPTAVLSCPVLPSRSRPEKTNRKIQLIRQKSKYKVRYRLCEGFAGSQRGELAFYGTKCS